MNSTTKKRILARVYSMSTIIIVALVFLVFTIATAAKGIRFLKPEHDSESGQLPGGAGYWTGAGHSYGRH